MKCSDNWMFIIINPPNMKIIPGVNTVNYSPKSYSRQWKNNKSEIEAVILITSSNIANIVITIGVKIP